MCSYNRINGLHVSRNEEILKTLLRDKLGFKGLIVSDWGAVVNLGDSIKAGLNLEMPGGYQNTKELIKRVENNTLTEEEIDEAITPLLKLMTLKRDTQKKINCDYEKNHKLAVTAVEESAVLLKNEDNILPLEKKTNLAILGPFARNPRIQGAGSSKVNPTKVVSFLDVLEQNYITYTYSEGYSFENENLEEELLNEAKRKAEKQKLSLCS
jgi:beta-glucosidase